MLRGVGMACTWHVIASPAVTRTSKRTVNLILVHHKYREGKTLLLRVPRHAKTKDQRTSGAQNHAHHGNGSSWGIVDPGAWSRAYDWAAFFGAFLLTSGGCLDMTHQLSSAFDFSACRPWKSLQLRYPRCDLDLGTFYASNSTLSM